VGNSRHVAPVDFSIFSIFFPLFLLRISPPPSLSDFPPFPSPVNMIIYKDSFSKDELISDVYPAVVVDDIVWEVEAKASFFSLLLHFLLFSSFLFSFC